MVTDGNERHRLHADLGKWMEAFCWVIGHLCAKIEKSDLISEQSNRFISQISFQIVKKIDRRDEDFFFFLHFLSRNRKCWPATSERRLGEVRSETEGGDRFAFRFTSFYGMMEN